MSVLRSIVDEFECRDGQGVDPGCQWCAGTGTVCAIHPWLPWGPAIDAETPCQCDADGGAPCKSGRELRESLDGAGAPL
jgi:hypothetical protein